VRNNENDIQLLFNDPNSLVERYQKTIGIVVNKFVYSGFFTVDERDDVIQYVNEKLLSEKIAKMQQQYKPLYFVVTYVSKIVYNLCLEYSRKKKRARREETCIDLARLEIADGGNLSDMMIIKEECDRLSAILRTYDTDRPRIELALKVVLGIGITERDVLNVYPQASEEDVQHLIDGCNAESELDRKTDKELYRAITQMTNKYENKMNSADALRKWISARINEIIELLNGTHKTANYSKETLKILCQYYYKNFHFGDSQIYI
jgi:RNA polymerase sigma factor (sigma-70 family)